MAGVPAFTIVVSCHNPGPLLAPTLASIREQKGVETELIVADLGSSDGSRAWLEAEGTRVSALILRTDGARAAALNEAIAQAKGEWLLFLQAGDRLVGDKVLSETFNWMKKTEAGVVAGEVAYDDGGLERLRSRVNPIAGNFLPLSAAFYRGNLFAENGSFDPSLAVLADYEFNARLWKNHIRFKPIPLRIAAVRERPSYRAGPALRGREEIAVRHRYFSALRCLPWDAVSTLRWFGEWLRPERR